MLREKKSNFGLFTCDAVCHVCYCTNNRLAINSFTLCSPAGAVPLHTYSLGTCQRVFCWQKEASEIREMIIEVREKINTGWERTGDETMEKWWARVNKIQLCIPKQRGVKMILPVSRSEEVYHYFWAAFLCNNNNGRLCCCLWENWAWRAHIHFIKFMRNAWMWSGQIFCAAAGPWRLCHQSSPCFLSASVMPNYFLSHQLAHLTTRLDSTDTDDDFSSCPALLLDIFVQENLSAWLKK